MHEIFFLSIFVQKTYFKQLSQPLEGTTIRVTPRWTTSCGREWSANETSRSREELHFFSTVLTPTELLNTSSDIIYSSDVLTWCPPSLVVCSLQKTSTLVAEVDAESDGRPRPTELNRYEQGSERRVILSRMFSIFILLFWSISTLENVV